MESMIKVLLPRISLCHEPVIYRTLFNPTLNPIVFQACSVTEGLVYRSNLGVAQPNVRLYLALQDGSVLLVP
jgi:hypothetical protein